MQVFTHCHRCKQPLVINNVLPGRIIDVVQNSVCADCVRRKEDNIKC
jgi:hypothetical protein